MGYDFFPLVLIPLLIYTYFWLNPTALATFMEGFMKYLVEVYLGYKAWRLEYQTKKAYRYYQKQSERLARERGVPNKTLADYFKTYKRDDWNFLYQREKEEFESKNRDLEDEMKNLLLF